MTLPTAGIDGTFGANVIENREFRCDGPYRIQDLADLELRRCSFTECQHLSQ